MPLGEGCSTHRGAVTDECGHSQNNNGETEELREKLNAVPLHSPRNSSEVTRN